MRQFWRVLAGIAVSVALWLPADAQIQGGNGVQQSGAVTGGNFAVWGPGPNQIKDGGSAPVQVNLTASVDPTINNDQTQGYQVGSLWQNAATGRVFIARSVGAAAAAWNLIEMGNYPGYLAGWWYIPAGPNAINVGSAPGANSIRLFPGFLKSRVTISNLGVRVTTLSAGGNVQAAIYANNPTTMRPTGNPLVSTASMSTTSSASVSATAAVQLEEGMYWFATNCDNGTAIMTAIANANTWVAAAIGSSTQANDIGGGTGGMVGLSVAQAFGAWPSLTAGAFTELAGLGTIPIVQFQVGSVP